MTPFFSVVIPTRNRRGTLERCLGALHRQLLSGGDFEVIVVDDGSTDGTAEALRAAVFPFPFRIVTQANGGPGLARNAGAAVACGRFLAFTEDDVLPGTEWLAAAQRHLAGGSLDLLEGRTVLEGGREGIRRYEPEPRHSFIPCNLFIRREIFERTGGYHGGFFDPATGLYFREDADLGFRLIESGCRMAIAEDVVVEHPAQFSDLGSCFRHVRRYVFDPLLYRRHRRLYREMIEVKFLGGIRVARPMHYTAVAFVGFAVAGALLLAAGETVWGGGLLAAAALCSWLIRFKYQGRGAFALYRLRETFGFLVLPLAYIVALLRGCMRFRSFGVLR